jgi:hypothetical protein
MWVAAGVSITRTISSSSRSGTSSNNLRPLPNNTGTKWICSSSSTPSVNAVCAVVAPGTSTLRSPAAAFVCAIALPMPSRS